MCLIVNRRSAASFPSVSSPRLPSGSSRCHSRRRASSHNSICHPLRLSTTCIRHFCPSHRPLFGEWRVLVRGERSARSAIGAVQPSPVVRQSPVSSFRRRIEPTRVLTATRQPPPPASRHPQLSAAFHCTIAPSPHLTLRLTTQRRGVCELAGETTACVFWTGAVSSFSRRRAHARFPPVNNSAKAATHLARSIHHLLSRSLISATLSTTQGTHHA